MNYFFAFQSDVGIRKDTNQDSCCIKQAVTEKGNVLFALICDGMGGLAKGELASATLIRVFSSWFEEQMPLILAQSDPFDEIRYQWGRLMKQQNQVIAEYGRKNGIQLGSTLTGLLILEDGRYLIGHIGDTRAYHISDQTADTLTEDQTVVARDVALGRITPEMAKTDPRRNVLLQCIGASRTIEPAFYEGTFVAGDCYMLCSDGFRHEITLEEIKQALSPVANNNEQDMAENLRKLIELNKYRHESDNITAMLIKAV